MYVPPLDWKRARHRVADFNRRGDPYYMAEVALHEVFRGDLTREAVPLRMMAVNSFWRAQVEKEPLALRDLCEITMARLPEIAGAIDTLRSRALPVRGRLAELTDSACVLLTRFLKGPAGKRTNYSFATKFLHWCCPSTLPPIDQRAAETINRLVGKGTIWMPGPNTVTTEPRCTESYGRLILFYNKALMQLTEEERRALQDHDFRTQRAQFRTRNSVVRILDKYLWLDSAEN